MIEFPPKRYISIISCCIFTQVGIEMKERFMKWYSYDIKQSNAGMHYDEK